jgi:hypothetical protein
MKLLVIEPELRRINGKPSISLNKSGCIHLNSILTEKMNLVQDSTISFVQDQDSIKDWYIKRGGKLKLRGKNGTGFAMNSISIITKIIDSLKLERGKTYSFEVIPEFIEVNEEHYFLIIVPKKS